MPRAPYARSGQSQTVRAEQRALRVPCWSPRRLMQPGRSARCVRRLQRLRPHLRQKHRLGPTQRWLHGPGAAPEPLGATPCRAADCAAPRPQSVLRTREGAARQTQYGPAHLPPPPQHAAAAGIDSHWRNLSWTLRCQTASQARQRRRTILPVPAELRWGGQLAAHGYATPPSYRHAPRSSPPPSCRRTALRRTPQPRKLNWRSLTTHRRRCQTARRPQRQTSQSRYRPPQLAVLAQRAVRRTSACRRAFGWRAAL